MIMNGMGYRMLVIGLGGITNEGDLSSLGGGVDLVAARWERRQEFVRDNDGVMILF